MTKIVTTLDLKILPRDLKSKDSRHLLSLIFTQWLSLSTCIIQTVIDVVPTPPIAQATRIPKLLYPDLYETTIEPKNKLEEDLYASRSGPKASVVGYVSKMFAVSGKHLPENKKKTLTADQMREKAREMRAARQLDADTNVESEVGINYTPDIKQPEEVVETTNADTEVLLGFARLYSGTISIGTSLYAVLPKYNVVLGPTHPMNSKYLLTVKVEGLYVMMGRELVPVHRVRAGNIFAIKGLESKVWRSATLCGPEELGIGDNPNPVQVRECLINLGSINRAVRSVLFFNHNLVSHLRLGPPYCACCFGARTTCGYAKACQWTEPSQSIGSLCRNLSTANWGTRNFNSRRTSFRGRIFSF